MLSRLLIATDLSPASFAVVSCLGGMKAYGAEHCLLVMCISMQEATATALSYSTDTLEGILEEQKVLLEGQGLSVETKVATGSAKAEINRIAEEEDFDLIVVGSQGHSLVGGAILGGVAYGVINSAKRPVLVIPIRKMPGDENACTNECLPVERCDFTRHVLFATDFSENADHAFSFVKEMAQGGARRITLLHVMDSAHIDHPVEKELANRRLESMKKILRDGGDVRVDIRIAFGSPLQEIIRTVKEEDVHLVAMGSQGRGFIKEIFLGSVSHSVARSSDAPVLLVPYVR